MESKKNNQSLRIIKPFGPSVVKFNIPEETLQSLNKYVDDKLKLIPFRLVIAMIILFILVVS